MSPLKSALLAACVAFGPIAADAAFMADDDITPFEVDGYTKAGPVLTDRKGLVLYTFDRDTPSKSTCNGTCAETWPPVSAADYTGGAKGFKLSVITRDDGSKQWAYEEKPLYRYSKDAKPGDFTGDKVGNVWHVVPISGHDM
ncbi:MAG: hypothetical protein EXQ89_04650 [Rhodospirillaceae bacterium]|nr:hypothetical protein [Rhodospirillaceae bacterium]